MFGFKRVGIAALLIAPAMALALPVQAAAPSIGLSAASHAATTPTVKITGTTAVFTPVKISVTPKWNGPPAACTTSVTSFTLANTTTKSQTVTSGGAVLVTLGTNQMTGICINKNQAGKTLVLKLKSNAKAKLTVTVK